MSCHNIGRGMNSVVKVVLDLYESEQLPREAATRLLLACRKGVYWCDGNEGETLEDIIERGYCGLCFEKTGTLSDVFDNDLNYPDCNKVFDKYDDTAAHYWLCPKCKQLVIAEYRANHNSGDGNMRPD